MDDSLLSVKVNCRKCRYRFRIEPNCSENWQVEAQCPSCEAWACFTVIDTLDPPAPDARYLQQLEDEAQKLGEMLYEPIHAHRDHPAVAWMDRVGNGMFEDDHTPKPWTIPTFWVYRFRRGKEAAYIWQEGDCWFVRFWCPLRTRRKPPEPREVFSFEEALDQLEDR